MKINLGNENCSDGRKEGMTLEDKKTPPTDYLQNNEN